MNSQETVIFAAPTAPAANAVATLFNSETTFGVGVMRILGMSMLEVVYLRLSHASATGGLIAYAKYKPGASETWRKLTLPTTVVAAPVITETATMPVTIAALSGDDNHTVSFPVTQYAEFKLEHTNSNNTLTAWELTVTGIFNGAAVAK